MAKTIEQLEHESDLAVRAREAAYAAKLRESNGGCVTPERAAELQAECVRAADAAKIALAAVDAAIAAENG